MRGLGGNEVTFFCIQDLDTDARHATAGGAGANLGSWVGKVKETNKNRIGVTGTLALHRLLGYDGVCTNRHSVSPRAYEDINHCGQFARYVLSPIQPEYCLRPRTSFVEHLDFVLQGKAERLNKKRSCQPIPEHHPAPHVYPTALARLLRQGHPARAMYP